MSMDCMVNLTAAEFGVLMAKALLEIQSSAAWFVFQQAVKEIPDNEDMEYGATEVWMKAMIAKAAPPPGDGGLREALEEIVKRIRHTHTHIVADEIAGWIIAALGRPAQTQGDGRGARGDTGRIAWAPRPDTGSSVAPPAPSETRRCTCGVEKGGWHSPECKVYVAAPNEGKRSEEAMPE